MVREAVRVVISNKADIFEKRINKIIKELEDDDCTVNDIDTSISFIGEKGYQAMAIIRFLYDDGEEEKAIEFSDDLNNINIIPGKLTVDCPSN